jgi:hypothetical protein
LIKLSILLFKKYRDLFVLKSLILGRIPERMTSSNGTSPSVAVATNGSSKRTEEESESKTSLMKKTWQEKLITKEDAFHHHKVIGTLVLIIMLVRFAMVGKQSDMGFLSHPQFTVPTILLHFLLNASSFQFRIPLRRIKDGGRIWPEYRLHAAVFAMRSMVTILLYHFERVYHLSPNYNYNYLIVMGGMLAADTASYSVSTKYQSRSVRDLDTHPAAKFFFSFMQFNANAGMLFGLRRCTLPYAIIFVTQTTPFVATLRRKLIFTSDWAGAFVYGAFLAFCAVFVTLDYMNDGPKTFWIARGLGQVAALQRMTPLPSSLALLQNKYVVWTTAFLLLRQVRSHIDDISVSVLKNSFYATLFLCLLLGYCKTRTELQRKKVKSI